MVISRKAPAFIVSFLLTTAGLFAQTYVNKEWVNNYGAPDTIEWAASTTDLWGRIVTTGNTMVSGQQANILITVFSEEGSIDWQTNWDGPISGADYGAAVISDNSGNIYVAGASQYNLGTDYDIVLLKYNWQGNLQWEVSYDGFGGEDFPVEMAMDNNGYIYITGASMGSGSMLDFITLKFDDGGNLEWDARYDFNGNIDIAASIVVEENGDQVTVTGGSESSSGNWDYTTVSYDINGSQMNVDREPSDEVDIRKPKDIVKDGDKNYYITGVQNNGTDDDVKLIKLDSTLQNQWVQVYNNTNEGSNALAIDDNGNLYVGGWLEESPGFRKFLLLKYDDSGNFLWDQIIFPVEDKPFAEITNITVDEVISVIGFATDGISSDIVTAQFSLEGDLAWVKTWENMAGSIDVPRSITKSGKDIYVSGWTGSATGTEWVTIKYSFFERDTLVVKDDFGNPLFAKNELIVRFDTSFVKTDAVDNNGNKEAEFGKLDYFLKEGIVAEINEKLKDLCPDEPELTPDPNGDCKITMYKIFRQLKSTHHHTTSRLGEQIPIPPFWATFVLSFPDGMDISVIADSLNSLFPKIKYAHPNFVARSTGGANDSLYPEQAALHPTSTYPNAHINIEPAWEYEVGKPFVKVGVLDDGIYWQHEDFGYDGVNPLSSKVVGGWDFQTNSWLKSWYGGGVHGSPVAGIVGAIRNNEKGIAGVAGGNDSIGITGVPLYGLRIAGPFFFSNVLSYIAEGIIIASIDDSTRKFGYGLHIMNNSWGFWELQGPSPYLNNTNITLLREAIHFANRNKVTFVAARGNTGDSGPNYPGVIDDYWVLCVGGTGVDGEYKDTNNGDFSWPYLWSASRGWEIDVAAPATAELVQSTRGDGKYQTFMGTSASVPFVSGVASLLMSYLNSSTPSNINLAPEDVEYIVQMTATDVGSPGVDSLTGHGRLNAGEALRAVDKKYRRLRHFQYTPDAIQGDKLDIYSFSTNDTITIPERYRNESNIWFIPGKYIVDTYKVDATVYHNLSPADTLVAYWPRPSSSNVLPLFDSLNKLLPRQRVVLNSVDWDSAALTGYIYKVSDTLGSFLGWWPFDTTKTNPQFAYSVLTQNAYFLGEETSELQQSKIWIYPNPTDDLQTIIINTEHTENLIISLHDISGREVKNIYSGVSTKGSHIFRVDFGGMATGMYFYHIRIGNDVKNFKVLKN
ncbi:MAG: S8 family serine peptidase [Cryomorphaceae bacterium]|nr:S8 family serine peptidase [Cryomorphaceae bacterium]